MRSGDRLAVVIITRDRAPELRRALARMAALPERPRLVVVDNGSRDGTAALVRQEFPDVELIEPGSDLGAAGRTLAVRQLDTPYVAFCDDDSWWAPGALERAVAILDAHPRIGLLAGRVLVGPEERLEPACAEMAASRLPRDPALPGPRVLGFVACGAIVRRAAFLQVGGFPTGFGVGGEERLLAADLAEGGWDLVYCDALLAYHHPSPVRDRYRRRAVQVRNDLWFAWLRRPRRVALRTTAAAAATAARERAAAAGLLEAVAGARRMLRSRRPVSPALEADLRLLDAG